MGQSTQLSKRSRAPAAVAVAGALMVLVGAQMPALEIELLGGLSYLDLGGTAGTVLVAAAIGALVAVVFRSRTGLALSAVALWVALLWPVLRTGFERLFPPERGALDEIADALDQAVGGAVRDELLPIIGVRAGAFVLLAGCVLVGVSAFRRGWR